MQVRASAQLRSNNDVWKTDRYSVPHWPPKDSASTEQTAAEPLQNVLTPNSGMPGSASSVPPVCDLPTGLPSSEPPASEHLGSEITNHVLPSPPIELPNSASADQKAGAPTAEAEPKEPSNLPGPADDVTPTGPMASGSTMASNYLQSADPIPLMTASEEQMIDMHAEGGHFAVDFGSESSFVDKDALHASSLALGEGQDGSGNPMFRADGSIIVPAQDFVVTWEYHSTDA